MRAVAQRAASEHRGDVGGPDVLEHLHLVQEAEPRLRPIGAGQLDGDPLASDSIDCALLSRGPADDAEAVPSRAGSITTCSESKPTAVTGSDDEDDNAAACSDDLPVLTAGPCCL